MVGIDRWGKEYASFKQKVCVRATPRRRKLKITCFLSGNAVLLDFPGRKLRRGNKQLCVPQYRSCRQAGPADGNPARLEKMGGVFAIHDLMSPTRYGNMQMFVERLKEQGYEQVELIDTTKGMFMSPKEAKWLMLRGSALIVGKKSKKDRR